ncbi:fungal hydrophobin [Ustulina deusta]|nr:fungal hydrophobin [Ustulina deusta]
MQLSTLFVTVLATAAMANPVKRAVDTVDTYPTDYDACTGLFDVLQCCATDVLGLADLDCSSPSTVPTSAANFAANCAAGGQRARCCVIPILGQSLLCITPVGL